jgi:hypothetical protein
VEVFAVMARPAGASGTTAIATGRADNDSISQATVPAAHLAARPGDAGRQPSTHPRLRGFVSTMSDGTGGSPPLPDQRLKQAGPVTGTNPLA